MNLTSCQQLSDSSLTPDVSISDESSSKPAIASYTAIYKDFNLNRTLYVMQVPFADLLAGTPGCPPANGIEFTNNPDYVANPRICSPSSNIIGSNDYECAVTAEHRYVDPQSGMLINGIKLYSNINGGFGSGKVLNFDPNVPNIIPFNSNTFPAITYNSEGKVSVAWTYNTGTSGFKAEVISTNYDFYVPPAIARTPNDYEYYMLVNEIRGDTQYASSVAGGTHHLATHPVFYTFTGVYSGIHLIVFKTSNTAMQPQIRKKNPNLTEDYSSDIRIYPNPASKNLIVDFSSIDSKNNIDMKLISIDGRLVYEKKGVSRTFNNSINVSSFKKGIYILEYQYDAVVKRKKIVLQ